MYDYDWGPILDNEKVINKVLKRLNCTIESEEDLVNLVGDKHQIKSFVADSGLLSWKNILLRNFGYTNNYPQLKEYVKNIGS